MSPSTCFAVELASARARIIHDPADAVVAVVADAFGLTTDPLAERGYQGPWYHQPSAVDLAIRVMVQGFGMTQTEAAQRMGYSPGRAGNARRPPTLDADELDLFDEAEALLGAPR